MIGWTEGNKKFSKPMILRKMRTFLKKLWNEFSRVRKNGCIKSRKVYSGHQKYVVFVKVVEDVVRRKEYNFGNRGIRTGWTEQIIREILRWNKYNLPAIPPPQFFHVYIINKESYGFSRSISNLHLWVFKTWNCSRRSGPCNFSFLIWKTQNSKLNSKSHDYLC